MEGSTHRTNDGVELSVRTLHGDQRPEFLLVHGLASNARLWDGVAIGLNTAGHTAVSVDLRGHGVSAKPDHGYDFATMAADLAGLIDEQMTPPVVLAGQSMGGNLVVEVAARYPHLVSGLVCVDGGFVDLRAAWPDWEIARDVLTPPPLDHLRSETLSSRAGEMFPGWPEAGVKAQLANLEIHDDGHVTRRLALESHLQILRSMWEQSPSEVASKVKTPVLVLVAEDGPGPHQAQVDNFVESLAEARVHRMPGHHDLHAQQPDEVVRIIEKALSDGFLR